MNEIKRIGAEDAVIGKPHIDSFLNESARPAFGCAGLSLDM